MHALESLIPGFKRALDGMTGAAPAWPAYRELTERLGFDRATRVLSHVALALLACDVLDSIAPDRQSASSSRPGAWT